MNKTTAFCLIVSFVMGLVWIAYGGFWPGVACICLGLAGALQWGDP